MAELHRPEPDLMTPAEVLACLRVTARTLYRLMRAGQVPAFRVGRQWRVPRLELDAWLRRQQPAPPWDRSEPETRPGRDGRQPPGVSPAQIGVFPHGD